MRSSRSAASLAVTPQRVISRAMAAHTIGAENDVPDHEAKPL